MKAFKPLVPAIRTRPNAFYNFQGLDTVRDPVSMDTGEKQFLVRCDNAYCDFTGQIIRDPAAKFLYSDRPISHVRFLNASTCIFSEEYESGVALNSSSGHQLLDAYAPGSVLSSTIFNRKVQVASLGQRIRNYNGAIWKLNESPALDVSRPAFLTTATRRLAVAGMAAYPTAIWLSRVDNENIFPPDEDLNEDNVLMAGYIDVRNMLRTGDVITGVASFEWNRLVVFTSNQAMIWKVDPNITQWSIEDQVAVNVGCASHNTIVSAGRDLLFCSRHGVHSIRRSQYNSLSVYSHTMSERVETLYRDLYRRVQSPQHISASFDSDSGRYHIFFPETDTVCHRLSALIPQTEDEPVRWSTGSYLNSRCADELAGRLLFGTPGGVYESYEFGQEEVEAPNVEADIEFPVSWAGSVSLPKVMSGYTLMCTGAGTAEVIMTDEEGRLLHTEVINVEPDSADIELPFRPLAKAFDRKVERKFIGIKTRIKLRGKGTMRVSGFAINLKA